MPESGPPTMPILDSGQFENQLSIALVFFVAAFSHSEMRGCLPKLLQLSLPQLHYPECMYMKISTGRILQDQLLNSGTDIILHYQNGYVITYIHL